MKQTHYTARLESCFKRTTNKGMTPRVFRPRWLHIYQTLGIVSFLHILYHAIANILCMYTQACDRRAPRPPAKPLVLITIIPSDLSTKRACSCVDMEFYFRWRVDFRLSGDHNTASLGCSWGSKIVFVGRFNPQTRSFIIAISSLCPACTPCFGL